MMASKYTKHYYTEGQRIVSKIGGGLSPSIVPYIEKIAPITSDSYGVISDRLYKLCQLSDGCVGFNGEYTNYGKTIKCVKPLVEMDEPEKDVYFYHSDHIGSSSFITDRNGYASQHLQYLPFGELFVEQRSAANYYTPYKFSGKEKDEETSYSYFGARYYMSDVSVWLSVDPMRDKYPNMSPYMYCAGNPIMLVDPDGRSTNPIYDYEGNFLGPDDWGMQCDAIVMNKNDYTPGMSHENAVTKGRYLDNLPKCMRTSAMNDLKSKINRHFSTIPSRPDYDGFISIDEGVAWAKSILEPKTTRQPIILYMQMLIILTLGIFQYLILMGKKDW